MAFELTLAMRLRAAYLNLHRRANAVFTKYGVTADQFVVLSVLAERPGLIQTELGGLIATDGNTVTAMLRVLERRGLVRRRDHAGDARARRVYLTAKGRRSQRKLVGASASLHGDLDSVADDVGRDGLTMALDRITATMNSPAARRDRISQLAGVRQRGTA